jgi:hypothetical protein
LRRTALPSAFFMLQPNRLISRPLGRRNIVNSRLARRRPSRYTTSYSERRTSRQFRGRFSRGISDARETVAPLLAALGQNFPSTLTLHALAEAVLLVTAAHMRLKRAFRQRSFSSTSVLFRCEPVGRCCVTTIPAFRARAIPRGRSASEANPSPWRNEQCIRPTLRGQEFARMVGGKYSSFLQRQFAALEENSRSGRETGPANVICLYS